MPQNSHEQIDYLELHSADDYIAFYLRRFTYLFEQYCQRVTLVKMKRAEYLINYTKLPLMDISFQLGYKDFHYFLRLFNETIGKATSDYIMDEADYSNYSI